MSDVDLHRLVDEIAAIPNDLHDRDFLLTWEASDDALRLVANAAAALRALHRQGLSARLFDTGLGISIFRDKSTRTRYSFRAGCNQLGLMTEELDESTSQIAHGETVRETATMISFLTEVIGIRDDMVLGEGHAYMVEVASALTESRSAGVLAQRPSVLNLQCDLDHPTQSMSDLCHLAEHFGGFEALRGKKLSMTWAHSPSYGKPLSVPQGVITLMTRYGMDVVLAHPEGYELVDETLAAAARHAEAAGGSFRRVESMDEAFTGADVVYPKSWAPMSVMRDRVGLRRAGDTKGLADLERTALERNARHVDWECTEERMALTRDGKALYLHCLPADISGVSCERGEVAASVFEAARLDTYREAGWKPFVIAALVLATRFPDPAAALRSCIGPGAERRHR